MKTEIVIQNRKSFQIDAIKEMESLIKNAQRESQIIWEESKRANSKVRILIPMWFFIALRDQMVSEWNMRPPDFVTKDEFRFHNYVIEIGYEMKKLIMFHRDWTLYEIPGMYFEQEITAIEQPHQIPCKLG